MTTTTSPDDQAVREKLRDALTPGFAAEFDPDEAQRAGAFVEDALSEAEAAASSPDLDDALAESGSHRGGTQGGH